VNNSLSTRVFRATEITPTKNLLYENIKARRGHGKAIVAVARHLAEAAFWMLKKGESYREPMSSTQG
jgi:hypothetical protein